MPQPRRPRHGRRHQQPLLDVIAAGDAVIPQDVEVVPNALGGGR